MPRRAMSIILAVLLLAGCAPAAKEPPKPQPIFEANGIKQVATVQNGHLMVYDGQTWQPHFWSGINLGATTPGHAPGELVPRKADYRRWLTDIKAMNAKVIRIYTILPPHFYEAFAEFNQTQDEPLWLVHGIWSPEEELIGPDELGNDAFLPHITETFKREITDAVAVVHGDAVLPERRGHASGTYTTDVSRWLLGWIVGTEWHQRAVLKTNLAHPTMPPFQGAYFQAKPGAAPFESWLAMLLDHTATEQMKYGWQAPLAFTNWATTDPLSHPDESNPEEDLVSVDPMMITPTDRWVAGYFAAYHIYPYYPDFIRYQLDYTQHMNVDGIADPYAGYLHAMREHHKGVPLIVAEFGVPSSRGKAHLGALDRNQGMHSEQEQGRINADMFRQIHAEGYDGAFLFEWADEWHKFTWNTIALELPADRRPIWLNRLTNEQHFGLIATEAGNFAEQIYLDGQVDDWRRLRQPATQPYPDFDLTMTHNEAYLYLLLERKGGDWRFPDDGLALGFSTLGAGSLTADKAPGIRFSSPVEFVLTLRSPDDAHLWINSAYDMHTWLYGGEGENIIPWQPSWKDASRGQFLPWTLMLNRPLTMRQSGQQIPAETLEVGLLRHGTNRPDSPEFNNLADFHVAGPVLELRLPWMLLGFTDPSTHQVWQYPYQARAIKTAPIESVTVEPYLLNGGGTEATPLAYRWERWDEPAWHERKKPSYHIMAEAFATYTKPKN